MYHPSLDVEIVAYLHLWDDLSLGLIKSLNSTVSQFPMLQNNFLKLEQQNVITDVLKFRWDCICRYQNLIFSLAFPYILISDHHIWDSENGPYLKIGYFGLLFAKCCFNFLAVMFVFFGTGVNTAPQTIFQNSF